MSVLEIGCGTGRNLPGFLKSGHSVYALDFDFDAISTAQMLMTEQGLMNEEGIADQISFSVARAENLPFIDNIFNEIHCIEVLHWAANTRQFEMMWMESWRVLQPGGFFFTTLRTSASSAEADDKASWFIADDILIDALAKQCNSEWIKRSGSTLVLRKRIM